ncbi:DUF5684 domain-containing protein [Acidiluteibacter ferrifornacis]|nr:DUF5684 domain-containing protein [Acidiluteibacter ferrifornacis]
MDPLEAVVSGLGMAFIFSFFLISSIIWLIMVIAHWKLFTKAGQPGWASIIPIFNFYILLKIIGKPSWWLILLFIPVANVIIAIWSTNLLAKRFGKDELYTFGLLLFPYIFYPILAFGSAKYMPFGSNQAGDYFGNK